MVVLVLIIFSMLLLLLFLLFLFAAVDYVYLVMSFGMFIINSHNIIIITATTSCLWKCGVEGEEKSLALASARERGR